MSLLPVVVLAVAGGGCATVANVTLLAAAETLGAVAGEPVAPEETAEQAEERVRRTIALSRLRLWSALDTPGSPACQVTARRTGRLTWALDSCRGSYRCWAIGEGGWGCDLGAGVAAPQL